MREFKNVLKRLQEDKVELSSEMVELNAISELKKATKGIKEDIKTIKSIKPNLKYYKSMMDKVEEAAEKLGFSVTQIEEYRVMLGFYEELKKILG